MTKVAKVFGYVFFIAANLLTLVIILYVVGVDIFDIRIDEIFGKKSLHEIPKNAKKDIRHVCAGDNGYLVLKNDNSLISWGMDFKAHRRGGGYDVYKVFDTPEIKEKIISMSFGETYNVVLTDKGNVKSWHNNYSGKYNMRESFINKEIKYVSIISNSNIVYLKKDGTINPNPYLEKLSRWKNIIQISTKGNNIIGLKNDGTLVLNGKVEYNVKKESRKYSNIKSVAAGNHHFVLLNKDGTVSAFGDNSNNQCNVPKNLNNVIAIGASVSNSLALKKDGSIVVWGNDFGLCQIPENLNNVIEFSVGLNNAIALKEDGAIVVW